MSEVTILNLENTRTLNQAYQNLSTLPGFVLLQSLDKQRGRYDILTAYPYERLQLTADTIHDVQAKLPKINSDFDLPFQGGAIGFFSYDFATLQPNIITKQQPSLKVVPEAAIGLYDWAIIVDHCLQKISLISANSQKNTSVIVKEIQAIWQKSKTEVQKFTIKGALTPLISKEAYKTAFDAIHADIRKGRCYQVNYTQPFHLDYSGSPWAIYESISNVNPVPYAAFLHYEDFDILSFSPERFMMVENRHLLASPIKGTKPRSKNKNKDEALARSLQACPKNRAENVMIVDLMRNDFGKIATPGSVKVPSLCQIESYEAVHHLVSHIEAQCLNNISPVEAFLSCFPGGSITGAPKRESMVVIAEQEPFARGVYCGSIGYISNHGRLDMNIAIRTITASQNILHLAAGGALVIDSQCEDEYDECFTKLQGILKGLF